MTEPTNKNLGIKALIIAGLIFILMIPTFFIDGLVSERKMRQEDAFKEVSSKWGDAQTITGPVVSIPYYEYYKDTSGVVQKFRRYIHILPDHLNINGNLNPEKRNRSLYQLVVYGSELELTGSFSDLNTGFSSIAKENILFDQAFVSVGISDLRGIEELVTLKWNDRDYNFNSGIETPDFARSGISAGIQIENSDSLNKNIEFKIKLALKGSQYIYFTPIGKETIVNLKSSWPSPKFDGAFLPDTHNVSDKGFDAYWKILHLNRNFPQRWTNERYNLNESAFGVNLFLMVDNYVKTDRSIKYAILFLGLTFLIFFFLELLNGKTIHPLQYILVGFALCVFYILLLSMSEHVNYNFAYIIAALMTIGLIGWYSKSILHDNKLAGLVAGNLIVLYTFIFTIIQLEDYALLMGSFGLFIILAAVMFYSRKINWSVFK